MTITIDFRCGFWESVLADVDEVGALITDPPFSIKTHKGQRNGRKEPRYCDPSLHPCLSSRGHGFDGWTPDDVHRFVSFWEPRTRGWFCAFTSHDLVPSFTAELASRGRYVFAPIACVQHARNVRLAGDGPSNWTDYLVVARRPLTKGVTRWGALPGAYVGRRHDEGENTLDRSKRPCSGGKPLWLMRAIVRDYSRPGELVCDPCAGGATTLIAAAMEGRSAAGSESNPETFEKAKARVDWLASRK
jgi:site-specific DNA-methyltransferase (adenine-specific)